MEQSGKVMLHFIRRFSRVGPLGKSVRVRLQDEKLNAALAPAGPVLHPKKYMTLETFEVNLYPEDRDPVLKTILEPGSAKRLLKSFDALRLESLSSKYSTQGIVTLWNMEFMYQAERAFTTSGTEGSSGSNVYCYSQDPTVNRIVSHIVSHAAELRDETLAASLYCMWRLKFDIRGEKCQTLINELLKRRSCLALPALARLCVVLRRESLYGNLVLAEFAPLLYSYIRRIASDQDVQLVSTAFWGARAVMTTWAFNDYVVRVKELFHDRRFKLSPEALCSVLRFLIQRNVTMGKSSALTKMTGKILRRAGNMLIPHVQSMEDADVVRILTVLDRDCEPSSLIEALAQRLSKTVEASKETCPIHIIARLRPYSLEEKVKLEGYLRAKLPYLAPSCQTFPAAFQMLNRSLYQGYDHNVFHTFWSLFEQILDTTVSGDYVSNLHDWQEDAGGREDAPCDAVGPVADFLNVVVKYVRACTRMSREYRHLEFEATASKLVRKILRNYEEGKCVITTADYAGCIAFLIATGHPNVTLKPSFLQQFRARHFTLLEHGKRLSNGNCSKEIEIACEQQFPTILTGHFGAVEYLQLARITSYSQGELFRQSMRRIEALPWNSASFAMEYLQLIKSCAYYSDRSFQRISKFVLEAGNNISWSCAAQFVGVSYACGVGHLDPVLQVAASAIEKSPVKKDPMVTIYAALGLCYHQHLSKHLANKIFSEEFLGRLDKHIRAEPPGSRVAADLRTKFMELNRAVCIDMPEAGIPWFHGKYCQQIAEKPRRWSSEHLEVYKALVDIIGSPCLVKNAYSRYFHEIDFLVHMDGKGNPVPVICQEQAVGKLAIIVHHLHSYTTGEERRLKGFHKLGRRHLETLGYRVIEIDPLDWRRLRSSKNRAEVDYLRECIFQ